MDSFFVTAIGTDSGKTLVSAILCKALNYNYWKPVQSGFPRDTETVIALSNAKAQPEAYFFQLPASPHLAALNEQKNIDLEYISSCFNSNIPCIVEGAGGVMVPLNDNDLVIDIAQKLNLKVVLISNFYLGSINHTLLTINELNRRKIDILGIVFNGDDPQQTKDIIIEKSQLKELLHIKKEPEISTKTIEKYANEFRQRNPELYGKR